MSKKYVYLIGVNDTSGQMESFQYSYMRMLVQISVGADGFLITYQTGTQKPLADVWHSSTVEDATRKCMLIQMILFGQNPDFTRAVVMDNDTKQSQTFSDQLVFGLIDSSTRVDLTPIRDKSFITNYIINNVQSKYENGIASIFSYIYAKSKKKEEDKFTYYWRAFNGLYSSLAQEDTQTGKASISLDKEKLMLQNWIYNNEFTLDSVNKLFGRKLDQSLSYDEVNSNFRHFGYIIRDRIAKASWTHNDVINALTAAGNPNANLASLLGLQEFIFPRDNNKMSVPIGDQRYVAHVSLYGFLMAELAYQMRCDYFHARKPILLYSTANNQAIKSLELINVLLENYLDNHIIKAVKEKIDFERQQAANQ